METTYSKDICPHCKEKIAYLLCYRVVQQHGKMHLEDLWFDKESNDEDEIDKETCYCPKCDKKVFIEPGDLTLKKKL